MKYKLVKRELRVKRMQRYMGNDGRIHHGRWYFEGTGHLYWEIHWCRKGVWEAWKTFDNRTLAIREIAKLRAEGGVRSGSPISEEL